MPLYTGTQGVQIEVYRDSAPTVKVEVLNSRMSPQYLEEIRANGAGSITIRRDDPKIIADSTLLDYRNILKVRVDNIVVGAFIIQTKKTTIVGEGEKAQEVWEISGEGLRSWGKDALVFAENVTSDNSETRFFNFASINKSAWYVASEWTDAVVSYNWNQSGAPWITAPAQWPDAPNAKWIWSQALGTPSAGLSPTGYVYLRKEFTIATAGAYAFFYAVDDQADIYVDGELKVTTSEHSWQETNQIDMDLSAGNHVIAMKAYNSVLTGGPAGVIAAMFAYGNAATPTAATLLFVSDSTWKTRGYPATEPGWTAGDILLTLRTEAVARNIRFAGNIVPTFTATLDSGGNTWDRLPISFGVGTSYEEAWTAIEELGADIYINPDTLAFNAYKKRGYDKGLSRTDGGNPVALRPAQNILTADETGQAQIVNTILLRTSEGWVVKTPTDTSSVVKYGVVEGQYTTDLAATTAQPLVDSLFQVRSTPERSQTVTFVPVENMVPFIDFGVGDYISGPNAVGDFELRRVMSISVTEDQKTGKPVYAVEFDAIFRDRTEQLEKWLSRGTGTGALSGGSANGSAIPDTVATTPSSSGSLGAIPDAPTGLAVASTGRWTSTGSAVSEFKATWNPVISGTGFGVVTITGYELWGKRSDQSEFLLLAETKDTAALLNGYRPTEVWNFRVRAVSRTGGPGPFSSDVNQTAAQPAASLAVPSTPTLTTGLGSVTVKWDGLLGGVSAQGYVAYVQVERRVTGSGNTWTAVGVITRLSTVDSAVAAGTSYDYRLIAVDYLGNVSAASSTATITPSGVTSSDITGSLPVDNLVTNGAFEDDLNAWEIVQQSTTGSPSATVVAGGPIGSKVLRLIRGAETAGTEAEQIVRQTQARSIAVVGGNADGYFISGRSYASAVATAAFTMRAYWYQADRTTACSTQWSAVVVNQNLTTTSQLFVGQVFPPSDARYMRVALVQSAMSTTIYADDVVARAVIGKGVLGNNVVQAQQISAGAVTANALSSGSVTTTALAAGSVVADKIAAGTITADKISASAGAALDISSNTSINLLINRANTTDANLTTTTGKVADLQTYYSFTSEGAVIGKTDSPFKLVLKNDQIQILQNGQVVSYWDSGRMVVPSFVGQEVVLANHKMEKYGTGTVVKAL